eukprot:221875-Rhodomonas_salina.1
MVVLILRPRSAQWAVCVGIALVGQPESFWHIRSLTAAASPGVHEHAIVWGLNEASERLCDLEWIVALLLLPGLPVIAALGRSSEDYILIEVLSGCDRAGVFERAC